jgi:CcmD family protein
MKHQLAYLGVAYTAIWAGIAGYLLCLGRRQRAIERRLDELQGPGWGHARVGLAVVGSAEYDAAPGRGRLHRHDHRGNGAYPAGWMQA